LSFSVESSEITHPDHAGNPMVGVRYLSISAFPAIT